ncbi:hypothetical protein [Burkholderia plantarii]|uniref:hypothetical protein n=1 Tax=Burkholderia plantarii TaxID=41899 RepID=UPI000A98B19E|nr:hypothetical protein [Burkholderia plantarii]
MAPKVNSTSPAPSVGSSSQVTQNDTPQQLNLPSTQSTNSLLPPARTRASSRASSDHSSSDLSSSESAQSEPLRGARGGFRRGPIALTAQTTGLGQRRASDGDLRRALSNPPSDLSPAQSLIVKSLQEAGGATSTVSTPAPSRPKTPEEQIAEHVDTAEQLMQFLADFAHYVPTPESSPTNLAHEVPLPPSTGSLAAPPGSETSSLSSYHIEDLFQAVEAEGTHTPSDDGRLGMRAEDMQMTRTGRGPATDTAGAAPKSTMDNLANWAANIGHVAGHETVAVGVTTALREVVAGLVQALQNAHQSPGSQKAQEAAAGALIGLIGLGNVMSMLMRRSRGTNTATADAGNVLQIAGLISSAVGAGKTGQLRGLLPQLTRTVGYALGRDAVGAVVPYKSSTKGANDLAAQGINTIPYGFNQFFVNWAQNAGGMSGAGYVNALHEISQMDNSTEADAARKKLDSEAPHQIATYVGANLAGEFLDKLAGSLFEQAIGDGGIGGIAQMSIRHEAPHMPSAAEWGDAAEKTISRMSLFGQALGSSAAIGTGVTTAKFGEFGGAMRNNAIDGALVSLLCLPFVMTLMKKKKAGDSSSGATTGGDAV